MDLHRAVAHRAPQRARRDAAPVRRRVRHRHRHARGRARLGAGGGGYIQLAIKESLLGAPPTFMWNAWTDAGLQQAGWFDYNDHFTSAEAGSPLVGVQDPYPVTSIFALPHTLT